MMIWGLRTSCAMTVRVVGGETIDQDAPKRFAIFSF
jgi:hypothetical protein